ncbi:hypothetical protein BM536_037725 [Streptomyces phaeoluteigriseus]|uniref:Uncharacterized protein n=1 Tax=Streptomyces phaeoluteigriseus TaxID=114686 RepID=A0A1V6MHN1_9ACTN|nr:hypothetical protein [Streptomyces phaeoluteigriseus]OQD51856.1 hypothetical protein BM536_037725 [Streptomyces phaeoluteigriseus]
MASEAVLDRDLLHAAWDSYRILETRTPPQERIDAQRRVQSAMDAYSRQDVARATVFLIGVLTAHLTPDGPPEPNGLDPLSDLIPGVLRRLSRIETADAAQAPMVAGVITAAVLGQDPVAWRDQFGTIPPAEALAHTYVLWLLADLLDTLTETPGATDQIMQETFASSAPDAG